MNISSVDKSGLWFLDVAINELLIDPFLELILSNFPVSSFDVSSNDLIAVHANEF